MGLDQQISIVLADDHAVVRAGIRQFLEADPGLRVVSEAGDGKIACKLIEQLKPDLAILDIQMPIMNGIEVTRWLRKENMDVKVLILSAFDDIPYAQAALKAGADGYEVKTAAPDVIIQAVHRVMQGRQAISGIIQDQLAERQLLQKELDHVLLSSRELEVLSLARDGLSNRQIAGRLALSERTVQNHISNILRQMNAASRTEAVMKAISIGLITTPGSKAAR